MPTPRQRLLLMGRKDIPWYLPSGITKSDVVAAYSPFGAKSLADSYINLVNPGTYNAAPGTAPTWDAVNGWIFNGSTQHLVCGFTPDTNYSTLLKFSGFTTANACPFGAQSAGGNTYNIWMNYIYFRNTGQLLTSKVVDTGIHTIGICGNNGFLDGKFEGAIPVGASLDWAQMTIARQGDVDNYYFGAKIQRFISYNKKINVLQARSLFGIANNPLGFRGIRGLTNNHASLGNVLQKERTDTYSIRAPFSLWGLNPYATVIFSNVPDLGPAYPGYELYVDTNGKLHVRIINNFFGNNYIGVVGSTLVCDGQPHVAWFTYDGSSTAAGVNIYLDGNLETPTVEKDTLSATTVDASQIYTIASQCNRDVDYFWDGTIGSIAQDSVVRDATFIAANSDPTILQTVIANRELLLNFDETTGLTAYDSSGNHYDATLTSDNMWV